MPKYISVEPMNDDTFEVLETKDDVIVDVKYVEVLPNLDPQNIVYLKVSVEAEDEYYGGLIDVIHTSKEPKDGYLPYAKVA